MNLSDVKIGDRLVTEKGGVVVVSYRWQTDFQAIGSAIGEANWNLDGTPLIPCGFTEDNYGNIIGRESDMNYEKEITDLKARLEKLEPKPEPKLPTEIGSHVRAGDGKVWVRVLIDGLCWRGSEGEVATNSHVLACCARNGGFQVGRVVWEAE